LFCFAGGSSPSRVIAVKGDTEYLSALSLAQGEAILVFPVSIFEVEVACFKRKRNISSCACDVERKD
jgi:predicted RNA methylase